MSHPLHDPVFRINCLMEDIDSLYHQAAFKLGVSDSVLFILYMVHTHGGTCLLHDIYRLSGISKQTINSAIRKLEHEGIVYLEKHNGKEKMVCLTEKGQSYANQTAAKLLESEYHAFYDWSEEEIGTYLRLIEKHSLSLRKQIEAL